jgi:16S rRNA (cytosine967-C5)-methyltransferase
MKNRPPDPVRQTALWILQRTESEHRSMDSLLRTAADSFDERDRRLLWALAQETIRWRARLDAVIQPLVTRPIAKLDLSVRILLRMAACQFCILDQIPAHAIVDEGVRLSHRYAPRGADRLVNAVSHRLADDGRARFTHLAPTDDPSSWPVGYSHPEWLIDRWVRTHGTERARAILEWDNERPPVWLRARPAGMVPPGEAGWVPDTYRMPIGYRPTEDPLFEQGEWTVQDPGEALVGHLPPTETDGPVLDVCSAPGTKTSHLCERQQTWIVASDRTRSRIRRVRDTVRRVGGLAELVVADATEPPYRPGAVAGVLVDAPCSNLGVLRRRVDARWNVRPSDLARHRRQQLRILNTAATLPRIGGWILYSVCTTEPEENEAVRIAFLRANPAYRPLPFSFNLAPELMTGPGVMRILPGEAECDGVYAALFIRAGKGNR